MLPENHSFLIRGDDGMEYGPVDLDELRGWVRENRAGIGTEVRLDEPGAAWSPWQNYPELIALLAEVQVTGPGSGEPSLVIAPVWRRLVAWMMDIVLLDILLTPLSAQLENILPSKQVFDVMADPTQLQNLPTPVLWQLLAFVIIGNACVVLYFTACHAVYGKTLAKALLRIRVVDPNGQKPAPAKAFVRALALVFSTTFFFPLLFAFMNPQRRTLHDLVAGTCVVDA
ncbi:MAG: RDD family protein [Methylacidiphilales bacterium]|nr:RDD family protein [Candidatus Methylacidiphilales bacterium]